MRVILGLCLILSLSACERLFYHPTQETYAHAEKLRPQPEDVFLTVAKSDKIHGWYFRNRAGVKPRAKLLFYHGNAQNVTAHFRSLYWLLDHPYDFFIFDYAGYGRSTGSPSPAATVRDGQAALAWLHARDPAVPIVLFGQSLGGAVALKNAVDLNEKFPVKLVITDSTFSSYVGVGRGVLSAHWMTWVLQWFVGYVLSDEYAAGDEVKKISPVPLVVMHGDADQIVPFAQGERIFADAAEPKEFWRIEGGRHIDFAGRPEWREKFLARLNQEFAPQKSRAKK